MSDAQQEAEQPAQQEAPEEEEEESVYEAANADTNNQENANPAMQIPILFSPWQGDLDLSTKVGKALWDEGIMPLETKFSGYGKDVIRFLADVQNRVDKCFWHNIVTFNNKSLITHHGEVSLETVHQARNVRDLIQPTTLNQARPKINALMMFHFIYDSVGTYPQKQLSTKLAEIKQDGPTLLKMILVNTFIATKASTFTIKEKFYDLNLKRFKWNVNAMNQDVREKMADLQAAGAKADETDMIITLFRAYNTTSNEEFKASISYWKNEWNSNTFTTAEELMEKAAAKYEELRMMGTWGRKTQDDQIMALTSKIQDLEKKGSSSGGDNKSSESGKSRKGKESSIPKWKFERSLSQAATYERNGKTYHWCTGPGHDKVGMWVIHDPGTCGQQTRNNSTNNSANKEQGFNKKALAAELKKKGLSEDEIESKLEAIAAVIED